MGKSIDECDEPYPVNTGFHENMDGKKERAVPIFLA